MDSSNGNKFTERELKEALARNLNPRGLGVNELGDVKELETAIALMQEGWLVFRNISCVGPVDLVAYAPMDLPGNGHGKVKAGTLRLIDAKSIGQSSGLPRIRQELRDNQKNLKHPVELLSTWDGQAVSNADLTAMYPERPTTNFVKLLRLAEQMLEENKYEVELNDTVLAEVGLTRKQVAYVMRGRKKDTHRYKNELKTMGIEYVPGKCNSRPKLRRFSK